MCEKENENVNNSLSLNLSQNIENVNSEKASASPNPPIEPMATRMVPTSVTMLSMPPLEQSTQMEHEELRMISQDNVQDSPILNDNDECHRRRPLQNSNKRSLFSNFNTANIIIPESVDENISFCSSMSNHDCEDIVANNYRDNPRSGFENENNNSKQINNCEFKSHQAALLKQLNKADHDGIDPIQNRFYENAHFDKPELMNYQRKSPKKRPRQDMEIDFFHKDLFVLFVRTDSNINYSKSANNTILAYLKKIK
ncbi:hypothetical protein RFI_16811 [Reticulomyxa filosa]|uniref:Uncharacterized protein n=1 Tax=Reticulomyxa filosa TaxID=46433 RepID=X6N534_RETFI|nr:hypothetical protein RFI_16811 [Reticulomyxa filosa]|eukprot:ETO20407.1 hypothetical protein RFI_16811 [Reticulomyxa filosa]